MNPPPRNPFALQQRVIGAFCDDLIDIGAGRMTRPERTNALREIAKQTRAIAASGTALAPSGLSRCASQAKPPAAIARGEP